MGNLVKSGLGRLCNNCHISAMHEATFLTLVRLVLKMQIMIRSRNHTEWTSIYRYVFSRNGVQDMAPRSMQRCREKWPLEAPYTHVICVLALCRISHNGYDASIHLLKCGKQIIGSVTYRLRARHYFHVLAFWQARCYLSFAPENLCSMRINQ